VFFALAIRVSAVQLDCGGHGCALFRGRRHCGPLSS
jgi:hypothetical protein